MINRNYKDLRIVEKASGKTLAFLGVTDASVTRTINGQYALSFTTFEQEMKTEYLKGNCIVVDNNTFDVAYIEKSHTEGGKILYTVEAYHVFYRLANVRLNMGYAKYGTVKEILTDLLKDTEFSAGQVDFTDTITFSVKEEVNLSGLIIYFANSLNGEVDFSDDGFTIDLKDEVGKDNGFVVELGKNIKGITEIYDAREGEEVTSYTVDLIELKNSTQYIQNGFSNLEVIGVGDTITIKDKDMGINTKQRIISKTYNPVFEKNTTLEIVTKIKLFTDTINTLRAEVVKKDNYYFGVRIDNEVGIEIERDDKLARTVYNANEFRMQKGDGTGSYIDSLYFDPIDQVYKFTGRLEATDIVGGTIDIGNGSFQVDNQGNVTIKRGSININDKFVVDNQGNMTAINGTFTGDINGGTIDIGNGSFVVDSTGNVTIEKGSININDKFIVDSDGNMTAINGTFTGDINGSNITGSTISGGSINVVTDIYVGNRINLQSDSGGTSQGIYFGADFGDLNIVATNDGRITSVTDKWYIGGEGDGQRIATRAFVANELTPYATKSYVNNAIADHVANYHNLK